MAKNHSWLCSHLSSTTDEHFFFYFFRFHQLKVKVWFVRIRKVVVRHLAKPPFERLDTKLLSKTSLPSYFWVSSKLNPWQNLIKNNNSTICFLLYLPSCDATVLRQPLYWITQLYSRITILLTIILRVILIGVPTSTKRPHIA